jgi:hypothetical protein
MIEIEKKIDSFKLTIFFSCLFLAAIPTEFTDCFGPYSPDTAAAAAMHYQFSGGYPTAPHGKYKKYLIKRFFFKKIFFFKISLDLMLKCHNFEIQ